LSDDTRIRALAKRFFDAIELGDIEGVRACYAPQAEIWHNVDGQTSTRDQNIDILRAFVARVPKRRYEHRRLHIFDNGFVQQHELHCMVTALREVVVHACLVCRVENDVIVRLDEYFDSKRLADFRTP
jgi:ketosteroid isomerase-like protein